jgi:hypothetical protein
LQSRQWFALCVKAQSFSISPRLRIVLGCLQSALAAPFQQWLIGGHSQSPVTIEDDSGHER